MHVKVSRDFISAAQAQIYRILPIFQYANIANYTYGLFPTDNVGCLDVSCCLDDDDDSA